MCEPHSIPIFDSRPKIFPMNGSMVWGETGIPHPHMFRRLLSQIRGFFHGMTKAGRADHGAIRTGEAASGDLVPSLVVMGFVQTLRKPGIVDLSRLG